MKTFFVSDLHVFSRRSRANHHLRGLQQAADQADSFILGGDIFDFRWSTLGSFQKTLDAAQQWIDELIGPRTHCHFHYLLGNHDCHPQFVDRLERLSEVHSNLSWHPEYLRQGNNFFLHGDVLDGSGTSASLEYTRGRWIRKHETCGWIRNVAYDTVVRVRLHKAVGHLAHPPQRVAKRLINYLHQVGHGPDTGTRQVYFGHTHVAVSDYQVGGVRFHNGGAPIPGLQFRLLEVRTPD